MPEIISLILIGAAGFAAGFYGYLVIKDRIGLRKRLQQALRDAVGR